MSFANGGFTLDRISIGLQAVDLTFIVEYHPGLLSGVTVFQGKGYVINEIGWQDELYREETPTEREVEMTTVPKRVWDNCALNCLHETGNEQDLYHPRPS